MIIEIDNQTAEIIREILEDQISTVLPTSEEAKENIENFINQLKPLAE